MSLDERENAEDGDTGLCTTTGRPRTLDNRIGECGLLSHVESRFSFMTTEATLSLKFGEPLFKYCCTFSSRVDLLQTCDLPFDMTLMTLRGAMKHTFMTPTVGVLMTDVFWGRPTPRDPHGRLVRSTFTAPVIFLGMDTAISHTVHEQLDLLVELRISRPSVIDE